jgi:predicted O-methyltransferase YrrM
MPPHRLSVEVHRASEGSWLARLLPAGGLAPAAVDQEATIEAIARSTQRLGRQPLWEGYRSMASYACSRTEGRSSDEVRSPLAFGRFYAWLAAERRPAAIVEFGTAFGISGMYWLAGLKRAGAGELLTFEPNAIWAGIARRNLGRISPRFTLILGTFEENAAAALAGRTVEMAFVDAIHTSAFVHRQFDILRRHLAPGALVLFDDINFSDDMRACWAEIARQDSLAASASVGNRVGIVELRG